MDETLEITLAGQVISGPLGATVSLPYFPWSPDDVAALTDEARTHILTMLREVRETLVQRMRSSR